MKLYADWKNLVIHAWSVRFALLTAALNGMFIAIPAFMGIIEPRLFAAVTVALSIAVVISRLVRQPKTLGDDDD
jgi:hypothetical protein